MSTPVIQALPGLNEHQIKTLALLLRRAIANSQLCLREQDLGPAGETNEGASIVVDDCIVDPDTITFEDGTAERFGIHLYVRACDLAALCGAED